MENLMKKEKQQKNTVKVRLLVFATLAFAFDRLVLL